MDISTAARLLIRHPRLFLQKGMARLARRLPLSSAETRLNLGGVKFVVPAGSDISLREMRWGLYEPETVELLRAHLRQGGTFIDVGANLGYLTAVAAGLVGRTGQVHSFEPHPHYHARLESLAKDNPHHRIAVRPVALGDEPGTAKIWTTAGANIGWNTMVPGFMEATSERQEVCVPVERLDDYCEREGVGAISLVKIDVEGFELPVLRGMRRLFETGRRPPIICEVAPRAYPHLDLRVEDLFEHLGALGYRVVDPFGARQRMRPEDLTRTMNLFLEPPDAVAQGHPARS